ncbi:hypothetical protein Y032_0423g1199 [Ancylostoma ceylanicum]|uniref:GIY-YIG domain-containing protein n=1 Tax=Ancylostoma ceylanicum TaxID=53326 RepID=A0A016X164_9BILA|nr:hypothetical protein Y032_0423g1199 [Ancylostoma ceylanicum]
MFRSLLRQKKVTEQFLHHSEFSRSLGLPMTVALVCACSIPLLIFVLMPFSLITLAGPSTLLAVLITFLVVLLSSAHLAELSCALPKNCVLYQFTYVSLGELPAFVVGWTAALDAVCLSTILCRAWSDHVNLLFRRFLHSYMSVKLLHRDSGLWIMSEEYDFTALCAALFSVLILCCNLRVVGTVSLCLVVVAILMTASCTMVGFFHADPQNWIDAQFFRFGFDGVNVARNLRKTSERIAANDGESDKAIRKILSENGYENGSMNTWRPYSAPDGIALVLPYVNEHISKQVNIVVKRCGLPVRLVFRPPPNLRDILTSSRIYESRCDAEDCLYCSDHKICHLRGTVYMITCSNCGQRYIGETGRPLRERLNEHRRALASPQSYPTNSSSKHRTEVHTREPPPLLEVKVLHRYLEHPVERKIMEAREIKRHRPEINSRDELAEALTFIA